MKNLKYIVLLSALSFVTHAADFQVTRTDDPTPNGCQANDCSLREALEAANELSGFHKVFVPPGDYTLTQGQLVINAPDGVSIFGGGENVTRISADQNSRIFFIVDTTAQLFNLHLHNGQASGAGGAISAEFSNLAVIESILSHNESISTITVPGEGGAIHVRGGSFIMRRSRIETNIAEDDAAGLRCIFSQVCTVEDSYFSNNMSNGSSGSIIEALEVSVFNLNRSTISHNTSEYDTIFIRQVVMFNMQSNTISNNTINRADDANVGALSLFLRARGLVKNNTFYQNGIGENIFSIMADLKSNATLQANILDGECNLILGSFLFSAGYNVGTTANCDLDQTSDRSDVALADINLQPLNVLKGYTPGHSLGPGSVARNRQTEDCDGFDQQGITRINPRCDAGAVETPRFCSSPNTIIPDLNAVGISDTIRINDISTITDLDVHLDISHSNVSDLQVSLNHSGTGESVTLVYNIANDDSGMVCNGDNLNVIIDQDEPSRGIDGQCSRYPFQNSAFPAFPGNWVRFRADDEGGNLLDVYDGAPLAGDWTLTVIDSGSFEQGTLNTWCVLPSTDFIFVDEIFSDGFE